MTLDTLARELRLELADSKWFKFHSRVVPSSTESIQISRWDVEAGKWQPNWDEQMEVLDAGNGPSFSRAAEMHMEGRGIDAVPSRSISQIGTFCHANHYAHCESDGCPTEGLPIRTPLCERIVAAVVEHRTPLGHIAWRENRPFDEVYDLAVRGLTHAKIWRHQQLHAYMREARELERDTRVMCPKCVGRPVTMRRSRPAA